MAIDSIRVKISERVVVVVIASVNVATDPLTIGTCITYIPERGTRNLYRSEGLCVALYLP